jgi:hypothetical protein
MFWAIRLGKKMKRVLNRSTALLAVFVSLMSSLVAGCGKSKADLETAIETLSGLSKVRGNPLSQEGAWPSSSSALEAIPVAKPSPVPSGEPDREPGVPAPIPTPSPSASPKPPEVGNAIQILGNICSVFRTELEPAKPTPSVFEIRVSGDVCPIEYFLTSDSRPTGDSSLLHFKARNQRARELSDVDLLDMRMDFLVTDQPKVMEIKLLLTGNSQKSGILELNLEGPMRLVDEKNITGEITGTLIMGEQYADVRQVIHLINDEEHNELYLNEQRLTEEQMKRVIGIFPHLEKKQGKKN